MDIIKINLDNWIKDWLLNIIYSNLEQMLQGINGQTEELAETIIAKPSVWNTEIWQMISAVANVVIVPIAMSILTIVMLISLVGWVNDKNNMHSNSDIITQLLKFVLKLGIGLMLVYKANDITIGIFDLGAWAISQAVGVSTNPETLVASLEGVRESLNHAGIGTLFALTFTSLIGNIGISILGLVTRLIVTGRMIEIYIYCSVGSAPYATFMNPKISGIGENYVKNLGALAFQGFFMFMMLGIYTVLTRESILKIASSSNPGGLVTEILFTSAVLCMMLLRSKSIAKSIFSAQ